MTTDLFMQGKKKKVDEKEAGLPAQRAERAKNDRMRFRCKVKAPMTTDLFMHWKKKKVDEKEVGLAAQKAERAKNDRMSGRELFLSDAS
ncbi:putative ZC3H15/TMA46 family protein [Helianthus anomalus]